MIPVLFPAAEREFLTHGLGDLADTISCYIDESRNGEYLLTMQYPQSGALFAELLNDRIILAKPNQADEPQPFRISRISKPVNMIVTVEAEHISYATNSMTVMPFAAENAPGAVAGIVQNTVGEKTFNLSTDIQNAGAFKTELPAAMRELMGGTRGSLLDVYGGEYYFNKWDIRLLAARGHDNGVTIEYGKNLIDFEQEENIQNLITGVVPFWQGESEDGEITLVILPEKQIVIQHDFAYEKVVPIDLSEEFEEQPSEDELRKAAQSFIEKTDMTRPKISITVKFVPLAQTEQYQNIAVLERVGLCDIVTVDFPALGVNVKAKVVRTYFDVLKERYAEIEIGDTKTQFSQIVIENEKAIEDKPSKSFLEQAILEATNAITGASGGYVVLDPPRQPQQILIMDKPSKAAAVRVWRWNLNGLGYSKNGINGPYELAMTMDGKLVADFIATGTLNAANINVTNLNAESITTGVLKDKAGKNTINMDTGAVSMQGRFNAISGDYRMSLDKAMLAFYIKDVLQGSFSAGEVYPGGPIGSFLKVSHIDILGTKDLNPGFFALGSDGSPSIYTSYLNGCKIEWKTKGSVADKDLILARSF